MVNKEYYIVQVTIEDRATRKQQTMTHSNKSIATPGYTRDQATDLAKRLTEEMEQREDVELVGVSLKQMGVIASAHLGMPTE